MNLYTLPFLLEIFQNFSSHTFVSSYLTFNITKYINLVKLKTNWTMVYKLIDIMFLFCEATPHMNMNMQLARFSLVFFLVSPITHSFFVGTDIYIRLCHVFEGHLKSCAVLSSIECFQSQSRAVSHVSLAFSTNRRIRCILSLSFTGSLLFFNNT